MSTVASIDVLSLFNKQTIASFFALSVEVKAGRFKELNALSYFLSRNIDPLSFITNKIAEKVSKHSNNFSLSHVFVQLIYS